MEKFKNMNNKTKITLAIIGAVIFIALVIILFYFRTRGIDYSNIKEDKNKDMVYTISTKKDHDIFIKNIPYLNLNFEFAKSINDEINLFIDDYKDDEYSSISYNYNINGDVLSLLVKMIDYNHDEGPKAFFKTYNINLRNRSIVTDQELLEMFNYDYNTVEKSIKDGFQEYYNEMVKEKYHNPEECDYECFMDYREVDNYLDNIALYVDGGKLYAYKPFKFYSIIGEEEFFKEKHFKFLIEDK